MNKEKKIGIILLIIGIFMIISSLGLSLYIDKLESKKTVKPSANYSNTTSTTNNVKTDTDNAEVTNSTTTKDIDYSAFPDYVELASNEYTEFSNKINDNYGKFISTRIGYSFNDKGKVELDNPSKDILENNKTNLINYLLVKNNEYKNDNSLGQLVYTSLEIYKNKYIEIFGSLDELNKSIESSNEGLSISVLNNENVITFNPVQPNVGTTTKTYITNMTENNGIKTYTGTISFVLDTNNEYKNKVTGIFNIKIETQNNYLKSIIVSE